MAQQEELGSERRSILILVDDIILSGKAEEQLTHLAMRGRHFGISLMMCAVSYTTLPKKARRSLDVLLVYSLPMQGDMKVMTWEFAHRNSMAEHVLRNLGEHEALVLETLQRRQQLFIWKADVLSIENRQNKASQVREILKRQPATTLRRHIIGYPVEQIFAGCKTIRNRGNRRTHTRTRFKVQQPVPFVREEITFQILYQLWF